MWRLSFGVFGTSVMELVSGSFGDELLRRISGKSREDDVSDDGVVKNQDEELPQLENNFESGEDIKERGPSIEEYIVRRNEEWIVDDLFYTSENEDNFSGNDELESGQEILPTHPNPWRL